MSGSFLNPVWTDRAPEMRILDPLGAESTEGSLQDRLLRPVLSIAITQRLRYLSYWAWVTSHVEKHSRAERALYEKFLLVTSITHDCEESGTKASGIMSGGSDIETALSNPAIDTLDISPESFTITSSDIARFDSYYKGVLYRLLLFEDEWTLTPLGEELAAAFDEEIPVSFDEVQQAVEREQLPVELVRKATPSGCLCQLSEQERDILTRAYWYLVSPTDQYEELAFDRTIDSSRLGIQEFLEATASTTESPNEVIDALVEDAAIDDETYSEDLGLFFRTGRDAFVRGSLVLVLSVGDWVQRRQTPTPDFTGLEDSREAWRLLVHSEHASHALQSLFIAVMEAVKCLEPVSPEQLLTTLFGDSEFDDAVGQALAGLTISEREGDSRSVLSGIRDAVYYGDAPRHPFEVSTIAATDPFEGSWSNACTRLQTTDPTGSPFELSGHSERAYRSLLDNTLSEPTSVAKSRRTAAYSLVQLARISSRYPQYYSQDQLTPYVDWFRSAHTDPGALTCWQVTDEWETSAPNQPTLQIEDWPTSPFALTGAELTQEWILEHYFERLYRKIKDGNGKSPQLLQTDVDGRLTFNHEINNNEIYNGGKPNHPTLKFDRLGDIFYELGLSNSTDLKELQVTNRGRQLITAFTNQGGEA